MAEKPDWWPECPYPESVFPMSVDRYPEIVPDPHVRTALSGALGRQFWELASDAIWAAMNDDVEDMATSWLEMLREVALLSDICDGGGWRLATDDVLLEQFDPWDVIKEAGTRIRKLNALT